MVLHELDVDLLRAEMIDMACYDPDDDDGDGETDATPLETVVPWDPDGGDDDRRRADGLHLLHLTQAEHDIIDDLLIARVPIRGVGSRCAWTPFRLPTLESTDMCRRPSPVLGGTFVIFPGGE